jgi:hypothetical protein
VFDVQRDFTFHERGKILPQALGFLDDPVEMEKVQKLVKTVRPNSVNKIVLFIELMVIELKLDNAVVLQLVSKADKLSDGVVFKVADK